MVRKPKAWELLQRLTAEECQELKQFAEQNGKNWKSKLIATWRSSSPQCIRVRNIVGEEWLSIIDPAKIPTVAAYRVNCFQVRCDRARRNNASGASNMWYPAILRITEFGLTVELAEQTFRDLYETDSEITVVAVR